MSDPGGAGAPSLFDPLSWARQLQRRRDDQLPFDLAAVPAGAALVSDSCFYIDALKGLVPRPVAALVAVVVTANVRDFDLLLQLRPEARVLFYRPVESTLRGGQVTVG